VDTRTNAEIKAEVEKLVAETVKINAEVRKAEADALVAELDSRAKQRKRDREKATDEENHLYRFSGEVSKVSVTKCMTKLTEWSRLEPKCNIEIVFSSPGGEIISGFELFDFIQSLRNSGHQITTGSLGYAASMAGILLMAGDVRWIGHQAWVMIHRAAFGAYGKTFEVEDEVELVKRIEERCLDIFVTRSKLTKLKIKRNWDRKDWWISADECLELQLVDEVRAIMPEVKPKLPNEKAKARKRRNKKK
jgi:ATP-dependent Clp endopeptidase proteolytic subunit ClpP